MDKRLYRSKNDKVIAGVCGGIAEYFNIDPTLVRLLSVVIILLIYPPTGLILYIACAIIIPVNPEHIKKASYNDYQDENTNDNPLDFEENYSSDYDDYSSQPVKSKKNNKITLGVLLIAIGAFLLFKKHLAWLDLEYIWPAILIIVGIMIIVKGRKNDKN